MDSNTLDNKDQTNTPDISSPAPDSPAPADISGAMDAPAAPVSADPAPSVTLPEPPAEPAAPVAPPADPIAPIDTEPVAPATPDLSATEASSPNITPEPSTAPAPTATAPAEPAAATPAPNPLASSAPATGGALDTASPLVGTAPILGTAPEAKQSPILNSAPTVKKKFDTKYMVPIIILAAATISLSAFLTVELLILKPNAVKAAETAGKNSVAAQTIYVDTSEGSSDDVEIPTLIPYSSSSSLDGNGSYLLSASGPAGVSVTGNTASTTAEFTVNWSEIKSTYPDLPTSTGSNKYTTTFGQSISQIFYGQIDSTAYFLFLLSDGTVDYINLENALESKNFDATGPIDGVEDVAKFLSASTDGSATILAQQISGDYYDLSSYLD